MYLSIKAYNNEVYIKFYKTLGGSKIFSKNEVTFDILNYHGVQITFYSNLTILFKGYINDELKDYIDIIIDKKLYVGSDEVGVGESIGPIIAVALKFTSYQDKKKVILNGIKDSKKMNAKEIVEKADFIKKHSEYYSIVMEPKKFNEVYKKLSNVKAINAIMQNELHKKFEGKGYQHITDQFVNERKYNEYISNSDNRPFNGKLELLTKAEEQYLEVAAAAIIAKSMFNDWVINSLKNDNYNVVVKNKLNSWDLFKDIESGKILVKDKYLYIKDWKK